MTIVFFMQDTGAMYGAERATLDLAVGLRAAGETPVFFLMNEARLEGLPSRLRAAIEAEGISIEHFPVAGRFSLPLARAVRARFEELRADVLHVNGYKAAVHARLSGIRPVAATVHGWLFRADLKERFYGWIERACLRRFDRVICLSSFYERLLEEAGVKRERLRRIPTGLDHRALPPLATCALPPPDPFTVLLAGRFSEEKNHDLLLRATARLAREGHRFRVLLAGDGPLRGEIERRIAELDLTDHVRSVGFVPMPELLPQTHALVLCSKIENLPLSIMEAMAWARPVIATRVGGVPDIVVDGETGLLVPSGDDAALADALRMLIADPARAAEMGHAGRSRIETEFTLDRMVAAHRSLFQEMARNGR